MRLVVISDLHADAVTLGVPRFAEVKAAVDASVRYAIDHGADAWLCLGDVADPDNGGGSIRAIELTIETALALASHRITSIFVAGNHDCLEEGSGATLLSPLSAVARSDLAAGLVHVAEQPMLVWLPPKPRATATVLCLPFAPVSHAYDPRLAATMLLADVPSSAQLIVASHLTGIPGIVPGEETTEMPRGGCNVMFPFAETRRAALRLQGHWHRRQVFDPCDGGPPLVIPGAPARFTFGEADNEPAFLVIDVNGNML